MEVKEAAMAFDNPVPIPTSAMVTVPFDIDSVASLSSLPLALEAANNSEVLGFLHLKMKFLFDVTVEVYYPSRCICSQDTGRVPCLPLRHSSPCERHPPDKRHWSAPLEPDRCQLF